MQYGKSWIILIKFRSKLITDPGLHVPGINQQAESNVHVGIEEVYTNPQQTWEEVTEGANSMYNNSCLIFAWTYNKKYFMRITKILSFSLGTKNP